MKQDDYCEKYHRPCPIEHTDQRITLIEKEVMDIKSLVAKIHETNERLIEQNEKMMPINEKLTLAFTGGHALGVFGGAIMRFIIFVGSVVGALALLSNYLSKK
jgi:hypothetical protein